VSEEHMEVQEETVVERVSNRLVNLAQPTELGSNPHGLCRKTHRAKKPT